MGAAKENRDRAAAARWFDDRRKERQNTNDAKALWWRDLMKAGHVLTFRAANGRTLTAGTYQPATGEGRFALLWATPGTRFAERDYFGGPWEIALRIVEFCGRVLPVLIDGEKTK